MTVILALDPGERTGWAIGKVTEAGELTVQGQGVLPVREMGMWLYETLVQEKDIDVLVYETWRLYPHMAKKMVGNDMQPSQVIGMARLCAWLGGQDLVTQGATIKKTAMKTMPDEIKMRFGLSTEQHDQDALMHLWHHYWSKYV